MKKYLLIIGYLCSFLNLHSQTASLNDDILDFKIEKPSNDKGWPDCQNIQSLKVIPSENEFFFEWDQELELEYPEYEVKFMNGEKESKILQKRSLAYNSFVLSKTDLIPNSEYKFKVRRRCYDKQGNVILSDWSEVQFMSLVYCDCTTINPKYKISGSCLALNWTSPCANPNGNASVKVTITAPSNIPNKIYITSSEYDFDYDISSIVGDITSIKFSYFQGPFELFCSPEIAVLSPSLTGCGLSPPLVKCNDPYSNPTITNQTPIASLNAGNIITIANISVLLTSVTNSGSTYSGTGLLATPFVTKAIEVTFSGISVNTDKQVFSGTIDGVEGDPNNYPGFNLDPDTISIGGEICLTNPPAEGENEGGFDNVTGLNERGFNQAGIHEETGTECDPNGFDIDGLFCDNKTPYDNNGCDLNGYDENGNICQPNGDPAIVNAFIDSVSLTLEVDVIDVLNTIKQTAIDSLANLDCGSLRSGIRGLISQLQFDSTYIVGAQGEYLKIGMSDQFTSVPQPLAYNSNSRNQQVKDLENKHIDLYKCDKISSIYQKILDYVEEADPSLILAEVQISLQGLTRYQVEDFKAHPENYTNWLIITISNIINKATGLVYHTIENDKNRSSLHHPMSYDRSSSYYGLASNDYSTNSSPLTLQEMKAERFWLFNQGYTTIKQLSRGYYLEELHKQMLLGGGENDISTQLPIKLNNIIDGVNYDIFIDNLVLKPDGAKLDAYFVFIDPNSGKRIVLEGHNINFGSGGLIGDSKLSLGTQIDIRLSNAAKLIIKPTNETYVSWDCEGFQSISLDLSIELCRNLIIPLDQTTFLPLPEDERYKIDVEITLTNWSDFYLALNNSTLTPFAIAGYEDFKWTLSNMVIDFSDYKSSGTAEMPAEYTSPFYNNGTFDDEWRGFYLGELSVVLPESFTSNSNNLTVGVQNVVIDGGGVSGVIFAENVIEMAEGNMGGWPFSIEDMNILVIRNHIKGGGFGGKVNVPILKGNMEYTASIFTNNHYEFTVSPLAKDSIDMMLAEVVILPNSMIQVKYEDSEFTAKATLHGEILVSTGTGKAIEIDFPAITFNELEISNKAPYFSPGNWGMSNNFAAEFYGFGINLKKIIPFKPDNDDEKLGLAIDMDLSLNKSVKIKASGSLDIIGKLHLDSNGRQRWKYDAIKVHKFGVDCTFSGGHVKGQLETFDNTPGKEAYGKGFQGFVDMKFNGVGQIAAVGIFGRTTYGTTEEYKYFMIDALAKSDAAGIPLAPIPLDITGFAGGVSYKMSRDLSTMDMDGPLSTSLPGIGESLSGVKYTPDSNFGLGLRAGAFMQTTGSKEVFNAYVAFEIIFNSQAAGGGVNEIAFTGVGQMMSVVNLGGLPLGGGTKQKPGVEATITLNLTMTYNFNQKEFHGTFYTFVNSPGNIIKGVGTDGKAIDAEVHFAADKWYVYVGTPEKRCGLMISIPQLGSYKLDAYIDIGSEVPDMAPLPQELKNLVNNIDDNSAFRNSGAGFVFGASVDVEASIDFGFLLTIEAKASLGFDLMMRNYKDSHCAGSQEEVGFGGWYASGQIYAYVTGELLLAEVKVLDASIGAVLQGQMPNPFYAKGTIVANYKNLLGEPKTRSVEVEFGKKCNLQGNNPNDFGLTIISHMNVSNLQSDVPVDLVPELYLNIPLDKPMTIGGKTYEAKLQTLILESKLLGYLSPTLEYKNNKTMISLSHSDFYSHDTITYTVIINVYKNGQPVGFEEKIVTFSTAKAYNNIKPTDVIYSYPSDGMYNYYREEYNQHKGFLKLKNNMPDLFYNVPSDVDQKIRISRFNGTVYILDYEYDPLNKTITWPMDPAIFQGNIPYKLELVRLQKGTYDNFTPGSGLNFLTVITGINGVTMMNLDNLNSGDEVNVTAENQVAAEVFYTMYFRVSEFNTFAEKLDANMSNTSHYINFTIKNMVNGELFGPEEVGPNSLVKATAQFNLQSSNGSGKLNWISSIFEKLYTNDLPIDMLNCPKQIRLENSNDGYDPVYTKVDLFSNSINTLKTDQDRFAYGWTNVTSTLNQQIRYQLPKAIKSHIDHVHEDINYCIDYLSSNGYDVDASTTLKIKQLRDYKFTSPPAGNYDILLEYKLPNGVKTSSKQLTLAIN